MLGERCGQSGSSGAQAAPMPEARAQVGHFQGILGGSMLAPESEQDPDAARAGSSRSIGRDQFDARRGLPGRRAGLARVRHLQGQAGVPARRPRADDARAAVQPLPRAVHARRSMQQFDLRYQPHTANAGEGEREIEEDDLTTAFYEDDEIDLGQLMREQFVPLAADEAALRRRLPGAVPVVRHEPESRARATASPVGRSAARRAASS